MPRPPRIEPSGDVVARIGSNALAVAQEGYTSAYRDVTGVSEPTTVLTFRSSGEELLALSHAGLPFLPPWSPTLSAWCSMASPTGTRWPSS